MRLKVPMMVAVFLAAALVSIAFMPAHVAEAKFSNRIEVQYNWTPKPAEQGKSLSITVSVKNKQASPMTITYVGVHFDWQAQNVYYEEMSSIVLNTDQVKNFTLSFVVPVNSSIGNHDYSLRIDYTISGTPYSEKSDKISGFEVKAPSEDGGDDDKATQTSLTLILGIGGAVVAVLFVLVIVLKKRHDRGKKRAEIIRARGAEPATATKPEGQTVAVQGPATPSGQSPYGPTSAQAAAGVAHAVAPGTAPGIALVPPLRPLAPPPGPSQARPGPTSTIPMPPKPPTPFGIVRSPKQATPGEDIAVPEGVCGNCGAKVKGRVCTECGGRMV
jgi:hypothetical protein